MRTDGGVCPMKVHYLAPPQRNTAPLARRLGFPEKWTMLLPAIYAHCGRQNRSFEGNAIQREKQQDWMAERVGFEPTVEFPQHTLSKRAP